MSYIAINAKEVVEHCERHIADLKLQRLTKQARMIKEAATKKRWFGLGKPWGYQKAFEYFENDSDIWSEYYMAGNVLYGAEYDELLDLKMLAQAAGDGNVNVSVEMSYIFK